MADMANILLQDDSDTTRTLLPISNANQNLVWRGNEADVPDFGQVRLTANWEKLKSGDWRLSAKLEVPVLETVGAAAASGYVAAPKVAYVMVGIFTMFAPARSTIADRANLYRMLNHAIAGASSTADSEKSAGTAAADAFKSGTSFYVLPYSFINLVMPN
jgi:hypothetical protein